ncbi:MAG: hypothetical protein LBV68_03585 [Spirochaetaceae bacterium]|jgi:hypothetical protein|nr:hypothetical protein [Spirochaetaceae bacterium]
MKLFVLLALFFTSIGNLFSEPIAGIWHRNYIYGTAELSINNDMVFSIEARNTAHEGYITGKIVKIKDGYYFSYIDDKYDTEQKCIIIFIDHIENIEVIIYGDQVGAGHSVYYDGIYDKNKKSDEYFVNEKLQYLFEGTFDIEAVRLLLGSDLDYFVECFGIHLKETINDSIVITGIMPGVGPYQNGIIKISDNKIYILITDCREKTIKLKYYTNDSEQTNIPDEFMQWKYFNKDIEIIKITGI